MVNVLEKLIVADVSERVWSGRMLLPSEFSVSAVEWTAAGRLRIPGEYLREAHKRRL